MRRFAVRIAPDLEIIVGAPAYFERHARPVVPQDLVRHRCISLRWGATHGHFIWEFRKKARELKVRIDGPLTFNAIDLILKAAWTASA
jgi:hypothetical protein